METNSDEMFESSSMMKIFAVIALITGVATCVLYFLQSHTPDVQQPIYLMQGILCIFLLRAYIRHDKNVMKGLIGAVLTLLLVNEMCYIFGTFSVKLAAATERSAGLGVAVIAIEAVYFLLQLAVFINHFVINSDHHSSPKKVRLNQTLLFVLMVVILVQEIVFLYALGAYLPLTLAAQLVWFVLEICTYGLIVCIESKLDAFRIKRESK